MDAQPTDHPGEIREYLRVLRTRKWSILVVAVALTGAALAFSFRQTPLYEAQARMLVQPFTTSQGEPVSDLDLQTERELVRTLPVADRAAAALTTTRTPGSLLEDVSVDVVSDTQIFVVSFTDASPAFAAEAANAIATAYIEIRRERAIATLNVLVQDLRRQSESLQAQLAQIEARIEELRDPDDPGRTSGLETQRQTLLIELSLLQNDLRDLRARQSIQQGGGEVVQEAETPQTPVSPNHVRTGSLALFLGLVLGAGVAFARERLDDSLRSRPELERALRAPVLAVVPRLPGWRRRDQARMVVLEDPHHPVTEAYRTLRSNLQSAAARQPIRSLLVTSTQAGEGKSVTAANLAVAFAQTSRRVVLIGADFRRPRLHKFAGVSNDPGLSEVLAGRATLWEVMRDPGIENLRVLPSGSVPPNPAELLESEAMLDVMDTLKGFADLLILDSPPVLAVADASILGPVADATLFVVHAAGASRAAISQAREQLETAGARVIGAVLNAYDPSGEGYGYYTYSYYRPEPTGNGRGTRRGLRLRKREEAAPRTGRGLD